MSSGREGSGRQAEVGADAAGHGLGGGVAKLIAGLVALEVKAPVGTGDRQEIPAVFPLAGEHHALIQQLPRAG
ncbi:hypothetical protein SDC9_189894 [bioreactor metagenome]|uniref:Uncharacterized protein n=1 Tax=bioreactor metagenome TaxID=1076179 RepID=A0A645HTP3_9ZZZZ